MFRKLATYWLVGGAIGFVLINIVAIAHYVFAVPIYNGHGRVGLAAPGEIARTVIALEGGSFLFAFLGALALYWLARVGKGNKNGP